MQGEPLSSRRRGRLCVSLSLWRGAGPPSWQARNLVKNKFSPHASADKHKSVASSWCLHYWRVLSFRLNFWRNSVGCHIYSAAWMNRTVSHPKLNPSSLMLKHWASVMQLMLPWLRPVYRSYTCAVPGAPWPCSKWLCSFVGLASDVSPIGKKWFYLFILSLHSVNIIFQMFAWTQSSHWVFLT